MEQVTPQGRMAEKTVRVMPPIQSGVPMPKAITSRRRWAFDEMKPGDSFFDTAHVKTIMNAARAWRLRNDRSVKFAYRKMTENGVEGVRVWRTL